MKKHILKDLHMACVVTRTEIRLVKNLCFFSQCDATATCNFYQKILWKSVQSYN